MTYPSFDEWGDNELKRTIYVEFSDGHTLPVIDGHTGELLRIDSGREFYYLARNIRKVEQEGSDGKLQFS